MSEMLLGSYSEHGLWFGAAEGLWEFEPRAFRRFFRRFGRISCDCPIMRHDGIPAHLSLTWVADPRQSPIAAWWSGEVKPPEVREAWLHRDGFGRFCAPWRMTYVWRPDFDAFMEWYEQHLAERAIEHLMVKEIEVL